MVRALHSGEAAAPPAVEMFFRAMFALKAYSGRKAAEMGLTWQQAMALNHLEGPLPMGEVAGRLHCDPSNVTGLADRLEEAGLATRRTDSSDRRVKQLVLTDHGHAVRRELRARVVADHPILSALDAEEQEQLAEWLGKVVAEAGG